MTDRPLMSSAKQAMPGMRARLPAMSSPARLEASYRARFDEAGADGHLRSSGFLRWAQDLAWIHAESLGFGREWYQRERLTWLIRGIELDLLDVVPYGSEMLVSTEVLGFRRAWARRRSEFRHASGVIAATALIDWMLLSETGRPARIPSEIERRFGAPQSAFSPLRVRLPEPPANAFRDGLAARHAEIDPMRHVNNAAYLDYFDEQLVAAGVENAVLRLPRRYSAEFLRPATRGMALSGEVWRHDGSLLYRLADAAGDELFRARLETELANWVGG
jgi:acyl-CoA thioesterase FadM